MYCRTYAMLCLPLESKYIARLCDLTCTVARTVFALPLSTLWLKASHMARNQSRDSNPVTWHCQPIRFRRLIWIQNRRSWCLSWSDFRWAVRCWNATWPWRWEKALHWPTWRIESSGKWRHRLYSLELEQKKRHIWNSIVSNRWPTSTRQTHCLHSHKPRYYYHVYCLHMGRL